MRWRKLKQGSGTEAGGAIAQPLRELGLHSGSSAVPAPAPQPAPPVALCFLWFLLGPFGFPCLLTALLKNHANSWLWGEENVKKKTHYAEYNLFATHEEFITVFHLLGGDYINIQRITIQWYRKEMNLFVWWELGFGLKCIFVLDWKWSEGWSPEAPFSGPPGAVLFRLRLGGQWPQRGSGLDSSADKAFDLDWISCLSCGNPSPPCTDRACALRGKPPKFVPYWFHHTVWTTHCHEGRRGHTLAGGSLPSGEALGSPGRGAGLAVIRALVFLLGCGMWNSFFPSHNSVPEINSCFVLDTF